MLSLATEPLTHLHRDWFWPALRRLWCRHTHTIRTERTLGMPPHIVCLSCEWREPVAAERPLATRTWDSTREQARYERQKKHREALTRGSTSQVSRRPDLRTRRDRVHSKRPVGTRPMRPSPKSTMPVPEADIEESGRGGTTPERSRSVL